MFFIVSNILIVLISILDLDSVSALPILVSEENDLEFNFDNSIDYLDNFYDRPFLFAAIDPSIAEDARLETVLNLFIYSFLLQRICSSTQYFFYSNLSPNWSQSMAIRLKRTMSQPMMDIFCNCIVYLVRQHPHHDPGKKLSFTCMEYWIHRLALFYLDRKML